MSLTIWGEVMGVRLGNATRRRLDELAAAADLATVRGLEAEPACPPDSATICEGAANWPDSLAGDT